MELKDLVPPPELCNVIPVGSFEDSVFGWRMLFRITGYWEWKLVERRFEEVDCPAPTLAEIVSELTPGEDGCGEITQFGKDKKGWFMMASFEGNDDGYGSGIDTYEEKDDANPATAALKLWMQVNKPDMIGQIGKKRKRRNRRKRMKTEERKIEKRRKGNEAWRV